MGEHGDPRSAAAVERRRKIACLLSGDFSLHEVMPDRSLRVVRSPRAEGSHRRLAETARDAERPPHFR